MVVLDTSVCGWGDSPQFLLHVLADLQCLDEITDLLTCQFLVRTCQRLQRLVRIGIGLTTQDGLDSLSHHGPGIVKVFLQLRLVEDQLTPTLRSTVESVRSRCSRLTGNLAARNCRIALAMPRLPSEFS